MGNRRVIVISAASDSVLRLPTKGKRSMKKILSVALFTLFIGSTAVIACDMSESDNMCKPGQVFDSEKGECRDASV